MNLFYVICTITVMQKDDKNLLELFGKELKSYRKSRFDSLNQFAFNNSLLTSATISRIENANVDFKFTTLIKIANALDMTPSELLQNINFKYSDYE